MRLPAALAAVAALALAAAGCASGPGGPETGDDPPAAFGPVVPPAPGFDFSGVVDPGHGGHSVAALHEAGHGLELVGHASVQEILPLAVRGSITQVDVWGDHAVVSGMEGGLAFALVDISDPAAPEAVGWFPSAADGWTARFSDDGAYVFYGCQVPSLTSAPSTNQVVGTCEDPSAPHAPSAVAGNPGGITVVDVSDRRDPRFVDFLPTARAHNLHTAAIGGTDYVFTDAVEILAFDRASGTLSAVGELPGTHDVTVARHPATGDWLLFTGAGQLSIYNVNDPTAPELVYEGTGQEGWTGWHEQTLVPGLVDGKAILLVAGETGTFTGGESLPDTVHVLDVTDPAAPALLGTWQPPFASRLPYTSYLYSAHEMAATPTGQVAVAWYHAGVWVLDVSTAERQAAPVTLAAYQPHEQINVVPSTFVQTPLPYVPFVWGAGWTAEGRLVVPDMHTGLYVLEPEWGLHPALDGGQ